MLKGSAEKLALGWPRPRIISRRRSKARKECVKGEGEDLLRRVGQMLRKARRFFHLCEERNLNRKFLYGVTYDARDCSGHPLAKTMEWVANAMGHYRFLGDVSTPISSNYPPLPYTPNTLGKTRSSDAGSGPSSGGSGGGNTAVADAGGGGGRSLTQTDERTDGLADREGGGGDGVTGGRSCLDREMRIVSVYELSGVGEQIAQSN
ncbi:hypothetical protein M0802_000567 [Mischocyttarus mexicanus]|nr:hypothetical protein M0802_000567 [Mischocyttarus mexicanus]